MLVRTRVKGCRRRWSGQELRIEQGVSNGRGCTAFLSGQGLGTVQGVVQDKG